MKKVETKKKDVMSLKEFRIDIKSEVAKLNILEEEFTKLTNQI